MSTETVSPDDPVAYFLQNLEYQGRSERTRAAYERVLRRFERFLDDSAGRTLAEAGEHECMAWVHSLRTDLARSTVATYATYLHRFYTYMARVGAFEANPMALVVEGMDETIDKNPHRRDISLSAMRAFVADIHHPLDRALVVTLLKTGMRVGELCNLDLRDLTLADDELAARLPLGSRALQDRENAVYVRSDVSKGAVVNGEERRASNKRKRATVVPVDGELRSTLRCWFAIRPDTTSPAEPLFLNTGRKWGERLTPAMVGRIVREHARENDWYRTGGGASENVTPHYFRHFFTTHLRDRTGDRGIVKYLRGDVASDVIDTYTHDWGGRVRERYLSNIYKLF
ncbi:tyrosine-type recombinase/integrase [Halococcus hamelinensis]|uniref:Integrase family protein n=1 Tax=Halococcus hamelinensis 100A6 TaxID=1132509 RepID=M0M0S6_9EURY|nr:tyrosine-type recombinase/integrase [Halococcus hamelinensis]EMA37980.1 integrase family protein [Halococcus hamelinensis 100A6]